MMLPPSSSRIIRISRSFLETPWRSCQFCRYLPPNAHLVAYWHIPSAASKDVCFQGKADAFFTQPDMSANDPKTDIGTNPVKSACRRVRKKLSPRQKIGSRVCIKVRVDGLGTELRVF